MSMPGNKSPSVVSMPSEVSDAQHNTSLPSCQTKQKAWEALFQPNYASRNPTFSPGCDDRIEHYKSSLALAYDTVPLSECTSLTPILSPTLPRLDLLKVHDGDIQGDESTHNQIILPCPSQSLRLLQYDHRRDAMQHYLDRLALLEIIRNEAFGKEDSGSKRIKNVMTRWKKYFGLVNDMPTHDEKEALSGCEPTWDEKRLQERLKKSYYYFMFGFLFPPMWIVGAFYTPTSTLTTTGPSLNRRSELRWKRRSQAALPIYVVVLLLILILVLVLKPDAVGWRSSSSPEAPSEISWEFQDRQ